MTLKEFDLVKLYNQYNKLYFGNQLPKGLPYKTSDKDSYGLSGIGIGINRVKGMLGTATAMMYRKSDRIVPISVHLSSVYDYTAEKVREILIHEMIHVYVDAMYSDDASGYYRMGEDIDGGHGRTFLKLRSQLIKECGFDIPVREDEVVLSDEYLSKKNSSVIMAYFNDYRAVKFVKESAIKKEFGDISPELLKHKLEVNGLSFYYIDGSAKLAQYPTSRELFSNKGMYRPPVPIEELKKQLKPYEIK